MSCPVPGCGRALGVTKRGDTWAMCQRHWARVPVDLQYKLWRAYRSWQRLERTYLATFPEMRSPALRNARAIAVKEYTIVRDSCINKASDGESHQLEVAL
jgi:hypothetical protein